MSRIDNLFIKLKEKSKKAFICYITAGDPNMEFSEKLIYELDNAGVGLLELGVPFSDPMADGPVIQEASERSLKNHTNLIKIFEMVKNIRQKSEIPLILFTYLNPVFQYGIENFARDCKNSGVDGALILDLPPDESDLYRNVMNKYGIDTIFIIAPTTDLERMKYIADCSSGFIYYVSRTGVTGEKSDIDSELEDKLKKIKLLTDKPVAIGFGISNPQQVEEIAQYGDGVVVGSAIVRRIKEYHKDFDGYKKVADFVRELVKPLK